MDGKGRCIDNVFIERLWRSLKYECVYGRAATVLTAEEIEAKGIATVQDALRAVPRRFC